MTTSTARPRLRIITTGGTIDKLYFDAASDYQIGAPQIGRILEDLQVALDFQVTALMRKDSLELTDADRQLIRDTVRSSEESRVLITHGTDTMVETARVLATVENKTMVMTGALSPARFVGSDAVFNIGCAVAACQTLEAGVYLAMNGRLWDPLKVRKNRDENRFEAA